MKKLIVTTATLFAISLQVSAQECRPTITNDNVDRPIVVASGGDKGNGGFVFSRTSGKLLEIAQNTLLSEVNQLIAKRSELVYQSEKCRKPIDLEQMKIKMANVDSDYVNRATPAINPEGKREERFFHINKCGNVEAARLYFEVFVDEYFKYQEAKSEVEKDFILNRVRNPIVHEALHEFGYNELEARDCSEDLISVLETYSETKLKRLQRTAELENVQAVKSFLISSKCLDEEKFQIYNKMKTSSWYVNNDTYYFMVSHHTLLCLQDKTEMTKLDPNKSGYENIGKFGHVLYSVKTLDEAAAWLNKVFKFEFVRPIPTEK